MEGKEEWKAYGVLTDYDLSSLTDATETSQQPTGTTPYMAQELLRGRSPLHLYRHDLESLFYIMLLITARHTIETPEGESQPRVVMRRSRRLPYQNWFDELRYDVLGLRKRAFLSDIEPIELSPVFKDFLPWLKGLQHCFSNGFKCKPTPIDDNKDEELPDWMVAMTGSEVHPVQFDDETLGGYVKYATVITPVPYLTGELKGLIIHDPECSSVPVPSASAGAAQVNK